ncbi:hypothetical protein D3C84_1057810 [compost metagenome]
MTVNFFHLVVAQAVDAFDIADEGDQIELLRIDLFEEHRTVRLLNDVHVTLTPSLFA